MAQKWKRNRSLKWQTKQKHNGKETLQDGNPSPLLTLRNSQLSTVQPELLAPSHGPQAADGQRLLNQEHLHSAFPLLLVHVRSVWLRAWVGTQECNTDHWPCTVRVYYLSLPFPTYSIARWKSAIKHTRFNQGGMKSAVCTNSAELTGKPYGPLGPGSPTVPFSP